jgi:two-component system chemotaxis response regulator CheB
MAEASRPGPRVIALVCSAGGLDALRVVLGGLPAELAGAVIVLQHQSPGRTSRLAAILGRWTALPVRDAIDGQELRGGTVTVVPPGTHALSTVDGRLALISSDGTPPNRPSADLLLCSLAVTAGPRTIAVVLSGGGHDGATGAVAVHDFGGTVIASDERTSEHFAMPSAAIGRDDAVDHVVPLDDIGALLTALCDHPETAPDARAKL